MHSDLKSHAATKLPIAEVAGKLGIPGSQLVPYGHDKAKIAYEFLESLDGKKRQADSGHGDFANPCG